MQQNNPTPSDIQQPHVDAVWRNVWVRADAQDTMRSTFTHRLFLEVLPVVLRHMPPHPERMLDAGGGTGRYGITFKERFPEAEVYVTDILQESLHIAERFAHERNTAGIRFQCEDVRRLSFPDNFFDVVFCDVVIQHLPDPLAAVTELVRVAKPGGRIIVSTMNIWNFHSLYKMFLRIVGKEYEYGYEKSYTARELRALLRAAGATVIVMDGAHVAYGLYRLRNHGKFWGTIGKILNRVIRYIDRYSGRYLSRTFGFELLCIASKP